MACSPAQLSHRQIYDDLEEKSKSNKMQTIKLIQAFACVYNGKETDAALGNKENQMQYDKIQENDFSEFVAMESSNYSQNKCVFQNDEFGVWLFHSFNAKTHSTFRKNHLGKYK
ncbi:MAG: hypothetical protein V1899_09035 [Planctomycetota bacterium]